MSVEGGSTEAIPVVPRPTAPHRTLVERLVGHSPSGFCIYRNQPIVLSATKWWRGAWHWTFLAFLGIFLVPQIVIAAAAGNLYGDFRIGDDFRELLALGDMRGRGAVSVPFLRDYAAVGIALLMAGYTAHLVKQWHRVTALPGLLRRSGLIPHSAVDDGTFAAILDRGERRFNSIGPEILAVAAGVGSGIGVAYALRHGMYSGLDSGVDHNRELHYGQAWANWEKHPVAFVLAVSAYGFYVYLMMRHALMGLGVLQLVRAFQLHARKVKSSWFGYDSPWEEVGTALREIRLAVNDIVFSGMAVFSVVFLGAIVIAFRSPVVIALVFFYAVYGPTLVFLPIYLMNRQLADSATAWRQRALRAWRAAAERAREEGGGVTSQAWLEAQLAKEEYQQTVALPTSVVDIWQFSRNLVLYVVPVIALIWALATASS